MAKITDYTDLNDGTEFDVDLGASTVELNIAGNLSNDGVTGQALFSALEDLWKTGATHNRYRWPFAQAVGELATSLEMQGGWVNADAQTLTLIRDSGLRFRSGYGAGATVTDEWCCLVQSGDFALASTQPYVLLDTDTAPTNLNFTGVFNELVKTFDSGGDDDRGSMKIYAREEGYTYGYYNLTVEQELSSILPVAYLVPMSTEADSNWNTTDANVAADAPYTGMTCYTTINGTGFAAASAKSYVLDEVGQDGAGRWFICTSAGTLDAAGVADYTNNGGTGTFGAYSGERNIDGSYYAYNKFIDGNSGTKGQVWEYHQYQLRQTGHIDQNPDITQRGDTAEALLEWIGTTLKTETGVYVDNFLPAEGPEYIFTDVNGVERTIADTVIVSAPNLIDDTRVRLYNVTAASEMENTTVSGGSGYSITLEPGIDYTIGDSIVLLAAYQQGGTAKRIFRGTAVMSTADVTFTDSQSDWDNPGPNTLGIDGDTVDECETDYVEVQVEVDDADDSTTKARVAAFIVDAMQTEEGIRNWVSLDGEPVIVYTTNSAVSIRTAVASVEVINTKSLSKLVVDDSFEFDWDDGLYHVDAILGSSIVWIAPDKVLLEETGVSGLTPEESADLAAIGTVQDDVELIVQDRGLDASNPKTITENTEGSSYDETFASVTKEVRRSGATTTITRTA